ELGDAPLHLRPDVDDVLRLHGSGGGDGGQHVAARDRGSAERSRRRIAAPRPPRRRSDDQANPQSQDDQISNPVFHDNCLVFVHAAASPVRSCIPAITSRFASSFSRITRSCSRSSPLRHPSTDSTCLGISSSTRLIFCL